MWMAGPGMVAVSTVSVCVDNEGQPSHLLPSTAAPCNPQNLEVDAVEGQGETLDLVGLNY